MSALRPRARQSPRIGITQRRLAPEGRGELRDALDVGWYGFVARQWPDALFVALPNLQPAAAALDFVDDWEIQALVFSGGEDLGSSPVRDACEAALLAHARALRWPVLGVCRGMQLLHVASGGDLQPSGQPVGEHHLVEHAEGSMLVNSFHRWSIPAVTAEWEAMAWAGDGSVEAMRHRALPWLATMWHPEREQGGDSVLAPWLAEWLSSVL